MLEIKKQKERHLPLQHRVCVSPQPKTLHGIFTLVDVLLNKCSTIYTHHFCLTELLQSSASLKMSYHLHVHFHSSALEASDIWICRLFIKHANSWRNIC